MNNNTPIQSQREPGDESAGSRQSKQHPLPSLSLPKGGGAVKGIEEKFEVNPVNGTTTLSFPLPVSQTRNDFSTALALSYNSGAGNSPFGLGWDAAVPSISRKTENGLPQYRDNRESDTFILSGTEDLVPLLKDEEDSWHRVENVMEENGQAYRIKRYCPRGEGLFSRIERWEKIENGDIHWRTVSRENVTSIYGKHEDSRIADPENPRRIFQWLLEFTYDDKGNCMRYDYEPENLMGVDPLAVHEKNRFSGQAKFTNRYIKKIQYGNKTPFVPPYPDEPTGADLPGFMFETVFDYGEHDSIEPLPDDSGTWECRADAFSNYRAGFEIRTYRLCQRVLLFHCFEELGSEPCLVRSMTFNYRIDHGFSFLEEIRQSGYIKRDDGTYGSKSLPPIGFTYQSLEWNTEIKTIARDQLPQAPVGIDNRNYQWVDLYGEGISGILTEQADAWFYKRNLGNGEFAPAEMLAERPSMSGLASGNVRVRALEANGKPFLVSQQEFAPGYFEMTEEEEWLPFRAFENIPNVDFNDPNLRFIDLDGDGRPDILVTEDNVFCWYASGGKKGYDFQQRVLKVLDEEQGSAVVFADPAQSIFIADMSGDGLNDIVRIRNSEIVYWPNLGYGKFGPKITMSHAPLMDHPDCFNPKYIRLADLDGSGTTDLIYLADGRFQCWFNLGGNAWTLTGDTYSIDAFPGVNDRSYVSVIDLLGNGTGCIVWSSPLPRHEETPLKYIDLTDSKKPYIMKSYKNNLGKEVSFHYKPSTDFYLEDKKAGTPWVTKLPFPVHCVYRVEVKDRVTNNCFVNEYTYHHGYYDHADREFRGFGRVDQRDTETYEHFEKNDAGNVVEELLHQPPVLTKTWFHTGAFLSKEKILDQFAHEYYQNEEISEHPLPEPKLPGELTNDEWREALRACKGMVLRQEVYAQDGTEKQNIPYTTTRHNYLLQQLQPKLDHQHSVFLVTENESIDYAYERNPSDPRIKHTLNLEIDKKGNIRRSAVVVYPRLLFEDGLPAEVQTGQEEMHIIYVETDFTNDIDGNEPIPAYRLRLPYETRTYELTGIPLPDGGFFSNGDLAAADLAVSIPYEAVPEDTGTPQKRLIEQTRTLYSGNDPGRPLPLGQLQSLALIYEEYQLAFTPGLLAQLYDSKVDEALLVEGGYVHSEGDSNWWIPSGIPRYPGDAPNHFYLPTGFRDPFGNISTVEYDRYDLLAINTVDPLGNRVNAANDYRIPGPVLITDSNQNRSAIEADELGMVIKTAVMGKVGSDEGDTLADPTSRMEYDLSSYMTSPPDNPEPNYVHTFLREEHGPENSRWQESYTYSDGSGNVVMTKARAEPGKAKTLDDEGNVIEVDTTPEVRWVGSGRTIVNNKGKPVKQYEHYFSVTPEFESAGELVETGVTPVLYYDPLGRLIKTMNPDGTFSKVEFDSWKQKTFDENDTVLESEWYVDRGSPDAEITTAPADPGTRAAWLAAKHADSPAMTYLDSLGRSFYSIADNKDRGQYATFTSLDIENKPLKIIDDRENEVMSYQYSIDGQQCYQKSMDAGQRRVFNNAAGNPLWGVDNLESETDAIETRLTYDELQRPTHLFARQGRGEQKLVERIIYGEAHPDSQSPGPDPEEPPPCLFNLRGRIYRQYNGAGAVTNEAYDFKGNLLRNSRRLTRMYNDIVDWISLGDLTTVEEIGTAAEALLEEENFTAAAEYDALNRPIRVITPHSGSIPLNELKTAYNEAGLPEQVEARLRDSEEWTPFVTNINYDAKGQRELIEYGNGVRSKYVYDPNTFRLQNLKTTRLSGEGEEGEEDGEREEKLQDLWYTYDPVGNITGIRDDAQQRIFYDNEVVEPHAKYEYDALYRLVKAQGREHIGQNRPVAARDEYRANLPHPGDGNALQNYTRLYEYDEVGNMRHMEHHAGKEDLSHRWTRIFEYEPLNNRLSQSRVSSVVENYSYDSHGNMTSMSPYLSEMRWDYENRLYHVEKGGVHCWYTYDPGGQRVRKVVEKPGGIKEETLYLDGFEIHRETRGEILGEQCETLHIMDDQQRIALVETKTMNERGLISSPASIIRFQLGNHLGSAGLELSEAGDIISYEEYYPYGSTSYQAVRRDIEVNPKRYRYTGMERDEETGLNYHTARYYAPWLGRWTGCDPEGLVDGVNLYTYSANNPLKFIDPGGNEILDPAHLLGKARETLDYIQTDLNPLIAHQQRRFRIPAGGWSQGNRRIGFNRAGRTLEDLLRGIGDTTVATRVVTQLRALEGTSNPFFDPELVLAIAFRESGPGIFRTGAVADTHSAGGLPNLGRSLFQLRRGGHIPPGYGSAWRRLGTRPVQNTGGGTSSITPAGGLRREEWLIAYGASISHLTQEVVLPALEAEGITSIGIDTMRFLTQLAFHAPAFFQRVFRFMRQQVAAGHVTHIDELLGRRLDLLEGEFGGEAYFRTALVTVGEAHILDALELVDRAHTVDYVFRAPPTPIPVPPLQ